MKKLVFDIETVGEEFAKIDGLTQEKMTYWLKRSSKTEKEYEVALEELKEGLGLSPLTGEIASIGVLDVETNKGAVYYQSPGQKQEDFEENGIKYQALSEKDVIEQFWKITEYSDELIGFNSRAFDFPFVLIRGAIHQIRPPKDFMKNRYLSMQHPKAKNIDLLDQLTFYGSVWKNKGNLHMWTRAFGIKSPKEDGICGDDVAKLFKEKKFLDIARYNGRDLFSTAELFHYWDKYLRF